MDLTGGTDSGNRISRLYYNFEVGPRCCTSTSRLNLDVVLRLRG